jgi:hypothetical protein
MYGTYHTPFLCSSPLIRIYMVPRKLEAQRRNKKKKNNTKMGCVHTVGLRIVFFEVSGMEELLERVFRTTCNLAGGFCYFLYSILGIRKWKLRLLGDWVELVATIFILFLVWIKNTPSWHKRKTTRKIVSTELAKSKLFFPFFFFFLPPLFFLFFILLRPPLQMRELWRKDIDLFFLYFPSSCYSIIRHMLYTIRKPAFSLLYLECLYCSVSVCLAGCAYWLGVESGRCASAVLGSGATS